MLIYAVYYHINTLNYCYYNDRNITSNLSKLLSEMEIERASFLVNL